MTDVPRAKARFEQLFKIIASQRFLTKQGLGNEVPFFICPFDPSEAFEMEADIGMLGQQLAHAGVRVLDVNLYEMSLSILRDRGLLDQILESEAEVSKGEIKELLQAVLDPATHIVPRIAQMMAEVPHDVIFLSGVGAVYPFIRSHNILNNLQSTAKDRPTVMFFPGRYTQSLATGASLDLFGMFQDDKYYRAFNIMNYEV